MVAHHIKKHRSTRSFESFSFISSLTMGRFCDGQLHTKSSNCFCDCDFASLKEIYG